jgi:hypothetical protein
MRDGDYADFVARQRIDNAVRKNFQSSPPYFRAQWRPQLRTKADPLNRFINALRELDSESFALCLVVTHRASDFRPRCRVNFD